MRKVGKLREERNQSISLRGNYIKKTILVINLNYLSTARKLKWEKSIEIAK